MSVAFSVAQPIVAKNKGSIDNRLECAGSQIKNNVITTAKMGLTAGTAFGATYAVAKSPKLANAAHKGMKWVQTTMMKNKHTAGIAKSVTKMLSKLPTAGKFGVIAAAIAAPILAITAANGIYKSGQIDQLYTDKASVASQLNSFIG